ncbi:MAG TPA: universal stress protein, partial [Thermomicrobiales bacterium]|nr:universal stress protein [Thermomicrobiales bacterium]
MAGGILAPLDGSALAMQALPYAAYLARRCRAGLLLALVVGDRERPTADEAAARAQLAAAARRLRAAGLAATTAIGRGPPARSLARLLRARAPALLVLATHGRSGPSRWALGGVCEQVLRASPAPVLLLTPRALAAGAPERLGRRLVVPIDGSELGRGVYPVVQRLARQLGDGVTLVRAVEPAAVWAASEAGSAAGGALPPDLLPAIETNLRRGLERR